MTSFKSRWERTRKNQLAKDTAAMTSGHFLRLLLQAGYFVTIARSLGPQQYGAFIAITAMVSIAAPFAGVGAPNLLLKNVSRTPAQLPVCWGNGIALLLMSGTALTGLLSVLGPALLGRQITIPLLLICASELILGRVVELASFAFTAIGQMGRTAGLNAAMSLTRLISVLLLRAVQPHPTLQAWSLAVLVGSTACTVYAFARVTAIAGVSADFRDVRREFSEGIYFAVSSSAATIYNDIDKTMLARLSDFASTGIYGAAYRIIDVSMAPIRGMTASSYAEFFRRGAQGPQATWEFARGLMKHASVFGALILIALLVGAPILPWIVGKSFSPAVEAVRWLAILPVLRALHLFLGDALSGAGYQRVRTAIQVAVALLNIWLNFYFISHWTWRGAAWSSVLCDAVLALSFGLALQWAIRLQQGPFTLTLPIGMESDG